MRPVLAGAACGMAGEGNGLLHAHTCAGSVLSFCVVYLGCTLATCRESPAFLTATMVSCTQWCQQQDGSRSPRSHGALLAPRLLLLQPMRPRNLLPTCAMAMGSTA